MEDREKFRELLAEYQALKQEVGRLENEMDVLVGKIATAENMSKKDCLQELLQAIVDQDRDRLFDETG